jgi:hypothetical protein
VGVRQKAIYFRYWQICKYFFCKFTNVFVPRKKRTFSETSPNQAMYDENKNILKNIAINGNILIDKKNTLCKSIFRKRKKDKSQINGR